MVTSVQKRMEPRRSLLDASVDQTDARNTAGWAGLTVPAEVLAHYPDLTAVGDPRPLFDTGEDDFRGDRD